ncbi:DEAD/DEAH box helicase [uncultured Ilumatobacter sp.]|uniref:DEAD/DEAH box helicase n=1 Tax=uncultured Ilumatobacter sp. TaxID=879968 RepID=UPI00374EDD56
MRADRDELISRYSFPIDRFQREAFDALDDGKHVVVAAPTGSGKTVVAEYGIDATIRDGRRAYYTAPVKALSNQKYRDLIAHHGEDKVGLLTGDNSINGDAPIVVMTTEVLRNMIYGRSRTLDDLGLVVLDEVHFLQDTFRGPVWEEVMIHLPHHVRLVCLSATVSNVAELAEWISTVRGSTEAITELRRPVELANQYLAKDRTEGRLHLLPTFVGGAVNRDAVRLDESAIRHAPRSSAGQSRKEANRTGNAKGAHRRKLVPPGRVETLELLDDRQMLPAIFFIFSRNQCDEAAKSCVDAGVRLTTEAEQAAIRVIIDERLGVLDPADLAVLGYDQFVRQLEAGVAAHHAGMVPPMKEVVEACFIEGLVKAVFATETLAVGINMPARSVVIEKLTKFTGEHHEQLTPGEYTQLTGRAGRRGIDDRGSAVVLWSPWVRFDEVAKLAGSSQFHLRSAFRPTYNMAANLIRTYESERAHDLLNLSFAQYQADRDIVKMQARLERRRHALAELQAEAKSPLGDIEEYRTLRNAEREARRFGRDERVEEIEAALRWLAPGTVIYLMKGKHRGPVVVMTSASRKDGAQLRVVNKGGDSLQATAEDFDAAPAALGSVKMPPNFAPNRKDFRQELAYRLRKTSLAQPQNTSNRRGRRDTVDADLHPVARDPDLKQRMQAAGQAARVAREVAEIEGRVHGKTQTLARDFDRILGVLEAYGYADVADWDLTPDGEMLARIFHECDLFVAEVVRAGLLDGLGAADLAALVSTLVYEHRSSEPPPRPWFSNDEIRGRWQRIAAISEDLAAHERSAGVNEHRGPDPTFAAIAYAWVAGEGFADVVDADELTGGDFVRTTRQLVDLLRQLAIVAPSRATRRAAGQAAEAAFRGVVSDSAAPTAPQTEPA